MPAAKKGDKFIAAAPDASTDSLSERKGVVRGRREQFTHFATGVVGED